jgi:broad specificity phosphatase PhoE
MSVIHLVRHGQASFGKPNYDELSELGRRQARILAAYCLSAGLNFDACYSGSLARQQDTAREFQEVFAQAGLPLPPLQILPEFDEYDAAAIIGALKDRVRTESPELLDKLSKPLDRKEFQAVFSGVIRRWVAGEISQEGLPAWAEFRERINRGINHVGGENGKAAQLLVFTSGGPIAVACQRALNLADYDTIKLSWQVINASVTRLSFRDQQVGLISFNNVSHLEITQDASLVTYR